MALTLNGKNRWPSALDLMRFADGRSLATRQDLLRIFERILDALSEVARDMDAYCGDHPEFREVKRRMVEEWNTGRRSLELKPGVEK
jgi:hypothetical protein